MLRRTFLAGLAALVIASSANAAAIFGLIVDPATTAGANTSSNRSGVGTWQVFALDDSAGNSGISSYDVSLTVSAGTMTPNHRSPSTSYDADGGGTPAQSGFTFLRQTLGNNTTTVQLTGAQNTPPSADSSANVGVDYYPISGFGQTASSFAAKYSNAILGPTTGATWGTYTSLLLAPRNGHSWVMIGEGTYSNVAAKPAFVPGINAMTVYTNFQNSFLSGPAAGGTTTEVLGVPEPATIALMGLAMVGGLGVVRRRRA